MPKKKLTQEKVLRMVQLHKEGKSTADIAKIECVGHTTVWRILTGRLLGNVTGIPSGTKISGGGPKKSRNSKPEEDMSRAKMRPCISKVAPKCEGTFLSQNPGHRICQKCRDLLIDRGDWG
jgi:transposase